MLTAENYPALFTDVVLSKHELLEIHRSKISLHRAKTGYSYPTIRLPYAFSKLAGLPTRIYQTVHDGALAFLVVVSSSGKATENSAELSENSKINAKSPALTWRRSPVRIRPSPSFFLESATLEPSIGLLSDTRIMAKKKHTKDKKLHNSHKLDLSWQEAVDLQPEDDYEDGSEIYYFMDQDGNIHSREFLPEELVPDDAKDLADLLKRKPSHVKVERVKPGTTDVVNLIPADENSPREIVLPVPKSGAYPLDIRISSEVAPNTALLPPDHIIRVSRRPCALPSLAASKIASSC
ncbi:MAG: hypothetical protein WBZ42_10965 [Halobacteriota archaeon]